MVWKPFISVINRSKKADATLEIIWKVFWKCKKKKEININRSTFWKEDCKIVKEIGHFFNSMTILTKCFEEIRFWRNTSRKTMFWWNSETVKNVSNFYLNIYYMIENVFRFFLFCCWILHNIFFCKTWIQSFLLLG